MSNRVLGIVGGALVALSLLMSAASPLVATATGQTPTVRQPNPPGPGGQFGPGFGRPHIGPR